MTWFGVGEGNVLEKSTSNSAGGHVSCRVELVFFGIYEKWQPKLCEDKSERTAFGSMTLTLCRFKIQ